MYVDVEWCGGCVDFGDGWLVGVFVVGLVVDDCVDVYCVKCG